MPGLAKKPAGRLLTLLLAAVAVLGAPVLAGKALAQNVLTHHADNRRSGAFVTPELSWERAASLVQQPGFAPRFDGNLYAQPLYWKPGNRPDGLFVVASESDTVTAIDAGTGAVVWTRRIGTPVPLSAFPCGNIDPLGVTGTPVIDQATGTLYVAAMTATPAGPRQKLFALSMADGAILPGWPVDVAEALRGLGQSFDSRVQNQRGALLLLNGTVYVPYGGFFGDCGDYHGWVVGVGARNPKQVAAWRTRARGGGIWAPGGIASDGQALYVTTGNTEGAAAWADGEAVIRLSPDLRRTDDKTSFFAPRDWRALDQRDADLGGSNPLLLDLPAGSGNQPTVLVLGKDQRAYLVDRRDLGGIGGAMAMETVARYPIRTSPAALGLNDTMLVAFQGRGAHCPAGGRGDLTVLRISAAPSAGIGTAWCGAMSGGGAPIVTTTDGTANPIVWIVGAEGDNRLHGFRGDTGDKLFTSAPLAGLRHFQTLIAADNRLIVGADGRLYAFLLPRP